MAAADTDTVIRAVKSIAADIQRLGMGLRPQAPGEVCADDLLRQFDSRVGSEPLRSACRQLFADGHYARAVEEAYKCLNNAVKGRSGLSADGESLMRTAFSPKSPRLKLNDLRSQSKQDEQRGYMDILAGAMAGVRNPRAHEHMLEDSSEEALELLALANHLFRKVENSRRARLKPSG